MSELLIALLMIAPAPQAMSVAQPFAGQQVVVAQSWSCSPRKTCTRIRSCDEARWYHQNCSWGYRLDGDSDGVPCESLCGSY
jgi:hypothetical protein